MGDEDDGMSEDDEDYQDMLAEAIRRSLVEIREAEAAATAAGNGSRAIPSSTATHRLRNTLSARGLPSSNIRGAAAPPLATQPVFPSAQAFSTSYNDWEEYDDDDDDEQQGFTMEDI